MALPSQPVTFGTDLIPVGIQHPLPTAYSLRYLSVQLGAPPGVTPSIQVGVRPRGTTFAPTLFGAAVEPTGANGQVFVYESPTGGTPIDPSTMDLVLQTVGLSGAAAVVACWADILLVQVPGDHVRTPKPTVGAEKSINDRANYPAGSTRL